jgi:hypothetical protein
MRRFKMRYNRPPPLAVRDHCRKKNEQVRNKENSERDPGMKSDYGFGVRFHGPFTTPLRVEVARSPEGTRLVVATSPIF